MQFTAFDLPTRSTTDYPYFDAYDNMRDVENIIRDSKANPDAQNYYGVAIIVKFWIYAYLTDAYGNILYLEFTMGLDDDNSVPAFAPQEAIYNRMLADLETANILLKSGYNISGDILYAAAGERNFISVGEATDYYENGISASFAYYLDLIMVGDRPKLPTAFRIMIGREILHRTMSLNRHTG